MRKVIGSHLLLILSLLLISPALIALLSASAPSILAAPDPIEYCKLVAIPFQRYWVSLPQNSPKINNMSVTDAQTLFDAVPGAVWVGRIDPSSGVEVQYDGVTCLNGPISPCTGSCVCFAVNSGDGVVIVTDREVTLPISGDDNDVSYTLGPANTSNLISIPFKRDSSLAVANDIFQALPGATQVARINPSFNIIEVWFPGNFGNNFDLEPGVGYDVRSSTASSTVTTLHDSSFVPPAAVSTLDTDNHPDEGFPTGPQQCDNCPTVNNNNQQDSDGDGIGDACETIVFTQGPNYKIAGTSTGVGWSWGIDLDGNFNTFECSGNVATGFVASGMNSMVLRNAFSQSIVFQTCSTIATGNVSATNIGNDRFKITCNISCNPTLFVGEVNLTADCQVGTAPGCDFNPNIQLIPEKVPATSPWGLGLLILGLAGMGVYVLSRFIPPSREV